MSFDSFSFWLDWMGLDWIRGRSAKEPVNRVYAKCLHELQMQVIFRVIGKQLADELDYHDGNKLKEWMMGRNSVRNC